VEGVLLSYRLTPQGSATLLFFGVGMALLTVILVGKSYGALPSGSAEISRKGVWICVASGLLMGIFAPFVTKAMSSGHTLTPYSTAVSLTLGALLCCFVFSPILMRKPLVGPPVSMSG
jgi:glucose uptake protein